MLFARRAALVLLWLAGSSFAAVSAVSFESTGSTERVPVAGDLSPFQGFVENRGQWPAEVRFFARAGRVEATLLDDALVLRPCPNLDTGEWPSPLILRLPTSPRTSLKPQGQDVMPTRHHFLVGERQASDVPGFTRVVYEAVAPGVDLVVRKDGGAFAYDLHFAAGAAVETFQLDVEGVLSTEVLASGALALKLLDATVEHRVGACWQEERDGSRTTMSAGVETSSISSTTQRLSFEAPARDVTRPFVLDPSLVFSTFLGGPSQELIREMDVDAAGNTYIMCRAGPGTPTTPSAIQSSLAGVVDVWVGKLSANGATLQWGTYLGGTLGDDAYGVNVDQDGTVVVTGHTWSHDFPVTAGAVQTSPGSSGTQTSDFFVTRLSADGRQIIWSTRYGGPDYEISSASALFPNGDVLLAGEVKATSPPATPGAYDTVFDPGDRALIRFSKDGTQVVFQTYFKQCRVLTVEIGPGEKIYFGGDANSVNGLLPTTPNAFQPGFGPGDGANGYVSVLSGDGGHLHWCTYLGGTGSESVWALAVDAAGCVYATGHTHSSDFPTTPGAYSHLVDAIASYAAKILPNGTALAWSTALDTCCGGGVFATKTIAVDAAGSATVSGPTNEVSFATTPDAYQKKKPSGFLGEDLLIIKLDAHGESLSYATWFGGSGAAEAEPRLAHDEAGNLILGFYGLLIDTPTTTGAYDTTYAGGGDLGVVKFQFDLPPWRVLSGGVEGTKEVPNLVGSGPLKPSSAGRISLRGAATNAPALLFAGSVALNAPISSGTFVPMPQVIVPFVTTPLGTMDAQFTWPAVPAGTAAYTQIWVQDAGAELGWSASNALRLVAQ